MKRLLIGFLLLSVCDMSSAQVLQYGVYKDVEMSAQGTAFFSTENSFFIASEGKVIGNCDVIAGKDAAVDFSLYMTSAVLRFVNPAGISEGSSKNYRCNGASWKPAPELKSTQFRAISPSTKAGAALYERYNNNRLVDLGDDDFKGLNLPTGNVVTYDASLEASNSFDTVTNYLIWARMQREDGGYRNALLRIKEADPKSGDEAGLATIKFDILVQR